MKFPDLAVSYLSVARIINKLKPTGSTNNLVRSGRPRKVNAEAKAFIEAQMQRNDETNSEEACQTWLKSSRVNYPRIPQRTRLDSATNKMLPTDQRSQQSQETGVCPAYSRLWSQQRESQNPNTCSSFMSGLASAGVVPQKSVFSRE